MRIPTKILTETSVVVALSVILKDVLPPIYSLPQGGSITVAGMVPLLWFSLRRGPLYGSFAGALYGLVHSVLGGFKHWYYPIQGLLDYPIAFAALGLAGFFRKHPLIGVGVAIAGRFISSFLAGMIFFTGLTFEGAVVSAIYNGTYLVGEFVISTIIIYMFVKKQIIEIYL